MDIPRIPVLPLQASTAGAMAGMTPDAGTAFLPHGYCYLWDRPLLYTHVVSDALIGLSYVVISLALVAMVHRARRDIPFHVLFVAFGTFIIACGMTHFMEIWTLWHPSYWVAGGVKVVTAVASVTTAAVMPTSVPMVLSTIRSARQSRDREVAAARAEALEEQNAVLQAQAIKLELQTEEAHTLAEELERANRELQAALERAEQATRAAEAASRAKSDFLAVMSHELRTPLNAIGGYAQLMELGVRGPVTDAQREDLARIQRSERHLAGLIDGILNFARVDAGKVRYRIGDVDVVAQLRDAQALVAPQGAAKSIEVDLAPCAPGLIARADPEKLRQIVLNLLSNAIKFTPAGGTVTLSCAARGGTLDIRVRDSGIGIPRDQLERVFEPFVQLDQSHTRSSEGLGLGLAISRDLARGMGGELRASSEPGAGTTFTLTVPAAATAAVMAG